MKNSITSLLLLMNWPLTTLKHQNTQLFSGERLTWVIWLTLRKNLMKRTVELTPVCFCLGTCPISYKVAKSFSMTCFYCHKVLFLRHKLGSEATNLESQHQQIPGLEGTLKIRLSAEFPPNIYSASRNGQFSTFWGYPFHHLNIQKLPC